MHNNILWKCGHTHKSGGEVGLVRSMRYFFIIVIFTNFVVFFDSASDKGPI